MILFTPNIYVTKYLEATNQLEASFKTKAVNFMKSGLLLDTTKKFIILKQFQFIFSALAWKPFSFEFFWQELHFVAYLMGVLWKQSIAA